LCEPSYEAVRRIPVYASIDDLGKLEIAQVRMGVDLRVEGRQERKRSRRRGTLGFVLNVVDDEAVDSEPPNPRPLLGRDGFELLPGRRLLGRSEAVEADSTPPR